MFGGRVLAALLVSLLALSLVAAPVYAEDPPRAGGAAAGHGEQAKADAKHEAGHTETSGGGHHEEPGVFAGSLDLAIWTMLVFLVLLFILSKFAWRPMLDALRRREESIRTAIEEAKIARAETERVRVEFQAEMNKAYEQIPKLMDEARRDAQRLAEDMRSKAAKDIQDERQRLRREIDMARDQALQEIWTQSAQLATLISAKALRREVSQEDHRRLVNDALNELKQVGAARR